MNFIFHQKKISGIFCTLPENEIYFDDEIHQYTFAPSQTLRLKKIMGYKKHRIVKQETSTLDFSIKGIEKLFADGKLHREEIGAVVVVTITPDHFVPHVSNQIQGYFNLPQDVICMDILQGCNGFLLGLMQSFFLLDYLPKKKVLLVNADVLSKKVSRQDRNSFPIIGDCAALTVVENDNRAEDIYMVIHSHGKDGNALLIPAGGSRLACSAETAQMKDAGDGNIRCLDNLVMDGTAVFQYVMQQVPPLIDELFALSRLDRQNIKWFLFHQPNRFMLQKLADRIRVPREKLFMNIVENFGNPSGASIPLTTAFNIGTELCGSNYYPCCLSAFGGGLGCGAMLCNLGAMDFCETYISNA